MAGDLSPERCAAALAYFLANMGMIDTPGGAEWIGRRLTPSSLIWKFRAAEVEVSGMTDQRVSDLFDYSGHEETT